MHGLSIRSFERRQSPAPVSAGRVRGHAFPSAHEEEAAGFEPAIEMMTYGAPRYDSGRWGQEVFRASPRQADLMIVAGRVSQKMAPVLRQIYDQMPNPKWVLAMGVCASTGGMFNNYAIVQGVDHVVPVDMYLPGCPPRPEMLIDAMFKLRDKVRHTPIGYNATVADQEAEQRQLEAPALIERKGLLR